MGRELGPQTQIWRAQNRRVVGDVEVGLGTAEEDGDDGEPEEEPATGLAS
jgi:hypothetical protein